MQAPKSERTKAREAFFLDFARAIRQRFRHVPLMVTGGFRSRRGMEEAVRNGDCDLIGVGRPSILDSAWPISTLFNAAVEDDEAYMKAQSFTVPWIYQKLVGRTFAAGTETVRGPLFLPHAEIALAAMDSTHQSPLPTYLPIYLSLGSTYWR